MSDDRPTLLHIFLYSFESINKRVKFVTVTFVLARDLLINLYTNSNPNFRPTDRVLPLSRVNMEIVKSS